MPVGAVAVAVALGQRDGLSLDRFALAAFRQVRGPRRMVAALSADEDSGAMGVGGPRRSGSAPQRGRSAGGDSGAVATASPGVLSDGTVDLGADGDCVLAVCSTVNFALRLPAEQEALVAIFARYLNSLTSGVQVLIRAERVDVSEAILELEDAAPGLPHPALEAAAREHAEFLAKLAESRELLRRQVVLALPAPIGGAMARRAAEEAARTLGPAGITVTVLDAAQAAALLASVFDPATPYAAPRTELARAGWNRCSPTRAGWTSEAASASPSR